MDDRAGQIAWAAGLFEGEGSAILSATGARTYSRRLSISNTQRDVLDRALRILGAGRVEVVSARMNPAHYKVGFRWVTGNWVSVERIANDLYPFLGSRRRQAIHQLFDLPPSRMRTGEDPEDRRLIKVTTVKDPRAAIRSPTAREWWAWAAGLFEGEGSAICRPTSRRRSGQLQRRLQVPMSDRDVLEQFRRLVGAGSVRPLKDRGPTRTGKPHKPMFIWTCSRWLGVQRIAAGLLPFLGARRTRQIEYLLAHPAAPVGGPHRTHCRRGHPLEGPDADVYSYGRERQCRRCRALLYEAFKAGDVERPQRPGRARTHCIRGHPLSGEGSDVYIWRGLRQCRPCALIARRERRQRGPKRARRRRSPT